MRRPLLLVPAILGITLASNVSAGGDGRTLFGYYRCAGCHGDNGKGSITDPQAGNIAGMESHAVIQAVGRLIAEGGHEDYLDNGCGETPSTAQIQAIADYVARLPK